MADGNTKCCGLLCVGHPPNVNQFSYSSLVDGSVLNTSNCGVISTVHLLYASLSFNLVM